MLLDMEQVLEIGEVACRTRLSLRALRFYEARGLVRPLRTSGGRRLYGPDQLARLSAVIALKSAGFSLRQIRQVLEGRHVNLAALVSAQLALMDARAAQIADARQLLGFIQSRIDRGEPIDVATLCSLIRSGDQAMHDQDLKTIADRYLSPRQLAEWTRAQSRLPPGHPERLEELKAKIAARLPLDPAGAEAQRLLEEWTALTGSYKDAVGPQVIEGLRKVGAALAELPDRPPGADLYTFLKDAVQARAA
jgi:DNA-binding transcriptional MerR regulator